MSAGTKTALFRRSGKFGRALFGRASLLAAMSCLTLGLTVAEPLVAASPRSASSRAVHGREDRSERDRGSRRETRTVGRTYSSAVPVAVTDFTSASPYPSAIQVSNFRGGRVVDVNVVLRGITHPYPDDIDVMLVAPDGRSTILMSDVGGGTSVTGVMVTIDDQALNTFPDAGPLVAGAYRPANYDTTDSFPSVSAPASNARLARLNGGNPNGEWRLYVVDDEAGYSGEFSEGWDLTLWVQLDDSHRRRDRR